MLLKRWVGFGQGFVYSIWHIKSIGGGLWSELGVVASGLKREDHGL